MINYYLKQKNYKVAELVIRGGNVYYVKEIFEKERLPYLFVEDKDKNIDLINSWIKNRGIPLSREDYDEIMERYGVQSLKELTVLGMGLNLTDHYWIDKKEDEKKWEDVNFHDNKFSQRIGELFPEIKEKYQDFINPDFSSNGHLRKIWIIDEDIRYLIKAGSGEIKQEPYNEYIASIISEKLGIDHVDYKLCKNGEEVYSKCPCMINKKNEFLDSFKVFLRGDKNKEKYNNYIDVCEKEGIKNAREEIDKMIVLDYLIRNTDRNSGNYGIIRNVDTLKWERIAPIFDNGNSFYHNAQIVKNIGTDKKSECRSFTGENEKNIELTGDISWFDYNKIKNMDNEIRKIFKINKIMEPERMDKIAGSFKKRLNNLENIINDNIKKESKKGIKR